MDARTDSASAARTEAPAAVAPPPPPPRRPGLGRQRLFIILGAVIAVAAILWFLDWLLIGSHHVTTDDAYVNADVADVTPLVSGQIIAAPIATDTARVKKGDVLVVIDPTDFKLTLDADEAALGQAERKVEGYFANRDAETAMTTARADSIRQASAQLLSAQADLAKARVDLGRRQALAHDGAVSGDELTNAENRVRETEAAVAAAQAGLAEAQANRLSSVGQEKIADALVSGTDVSSNPEVAAAQAKVDQDKINLQRTVIRAPLDGIIAKNTVEVGQRVATGADLMTIVPIQAVYVDANFKEDQLRKMHIGQPAVMTSDRWGGGVKFHGKVVGIAGGTGSAFAVIPAQNATGNWIKIVQRLPVKIEFADPHELARYPLDVGLSMNVDVDTAK